MFLYLSLLSLFRLEQQSASLNSELSICVNAVDQTRPDQDWDIATRNQYDSAMNEAIGSSTAGEAVPYLSYALAMRNFADNPEQAANDEFLGVWHERRNTNKRSNRNAT